VELAPADVATAVLKPLVRTLPLSGSVQPVDQATLKSKVSGEVLEMTLREGQSVKRGELLARIDTRNAGPNRDAAAAALEKARADLAIAKLNYGNSVKLQEQQFVSQNSVDSTKAIYDAAAANAKSAEANLRLASVALEDATVRAPFDGVVAKREVQVGEKVSPDTPIITLVDLRRMELDAPAPTSEMPAVKVGQTARFHVDGFGDREFIGTVWRVNPVAESGSRSIMVYLTMPNEDSALKGGMFAQGALALDAGTPVPAIPLAAVRDDAGVSFVWLIDGGVIRRRGVTLGLKAPGEGLVEIREGLSAGEQVVVPRIDTLKEGTKVTVVAASSPPAAGEVPRDAPKPAADAH
jgi:RND family efflux transporter MFP subunit